MIFNQRTYWIATLGQLVSCVIVVATFNRVNLSAQIEPAVKPLDGYNFVSFHASLLPSVGGLDDGVIPTPNQTFAFSTPSGIGHEFGVSWSRLMPKLFVSTSTTFDLRLSWIQLREQIVATGQIESGGSQGYPVVENVRQVTEGSVNIVALGARFAFDTEPMAQRSPTITIGGTLGHIMGIDYRTTFDPEGSVPISEFGLPVTGPTPDRRYIFGSLHLGFGGRFNFGSVEHSVALAPEAEVQIPLTSLLKKSTWVPFGLRIGLSLRFPM